MADLLKNLRAELREIADAKRAPQMQAYMKSEMPYHGISSPNLKKLTKEFFREMEFPSTKVWQSQVLGLWREAKFREERYAALSLSGHKNAKAFQTPTAMKMYEELIVTGAWWDYVDDIATHRVGPILVDHPKPMKAKMLNWSKCGDMWKRRTSIICQIGAKDDLDLGLLYQCIKPSMDSKEFFLRKAIGWALRQVAWSDPKEIIAYVRKNKDKLSPLTQREALKNIKRGAL